MRTHKSLTCGIAAPCYCPAGYCAISRPAYEIVEEASVRMRTLEVAAIIITVFCAMTLTNALLAMAYA